MEVVRDGGGKGWWWWGMEMVRVGCVVDRAW